jgi:hypothetical protein
VIVFWLRRLTMACAFLLAFGLLELFAYVLAEAAFGEGGGSMVDGYWRGRLPWMGIAEALIVVGATASAVAGLLAAEVGGGWLRRILVLPPLAVMGLWWFLAMAIRRAVPCPECPPPVPDPWAYAYSAPDQTALFLLLPAAVVVFLALAPLGRKRRAASLPGAVTAQ